MTHLVQRSTNSNAHSQNQSKEKLDLVGVLTLLNAS